MSWEAKTQIFIGDRFSVEINPSELGYQAEITPRWRYNNMLPLQRVYLCGSDISELKTQAEKICDALKPFVRFEGE